MTAEVAILNRSAVALAADSAVTLSVRGQDKIYNSVDKLFHLSHSQPIAIMVYGGAEYMGIPLETIIKGFRETKYCQPQETTEQYATKFFEFLSKEITHEESYIEKHIAELFHARFASIQQKVTKKFVQNIALKKISKNFSPKVVLKEYTNTYLKASIEAFSKRPDIPDLTSDQLLKSYPDIAAELAADILPEYDDSMLLSVVEFAKLILTKDAFSSSHTGFVFSGFGTKELFPALHTYICDGVIGTGIKKKPDVQVRIDRDGICAHIEPFAQKEMVERFINGIDSSYNNYVKSNVREALMEFGKTIIESHGPRAKKTRAEAMQALVQAVDGYVAVFSEKSEKRQEETFRQKVLDMVHYMPKSDLAAMAESLVNLTSIKRRVSAERETVGGPVDVAVVSRSDGFVWVKRKHYFTSDLNPRYFANQRIKVQNRKEAEAYE